MKQFTDKEIESMVRNYVAPRMYEMYEWRQDDLEIVIERNLPAHVLFEVRGMYESPIECTDAVLNDFAAMFGAAMVEKYDDISEHGSDTCDYGSSYGFAVRLWS